MLEQDKIIIVTVPTIEDLYRFIDVYKVTSYQFNVDTKKKMYKVIFNTKKNYILNYNFYKSKYEIEEILL